jgi:hypothetical protein
MLFLIAFIFCLFGSAICLLASFFLLPWARDRLGGWALALIPASTFAGTYMGWVMMWAVFSWFGS